MLISGETFIQRHGVRFYEIPISIQKTFPCGVILDLVQRSLIYLPKALIRIIKYGESDKYLAIPAFYGVPFLINDDVELAVAVNADGVHVGQHDMEAGQVREKIGPDKILGVSAQTVEQALRAQAAGADYLGVGAVFPTGTKDDADAVSYDTLKAICAAVSIPVVAIGAHNVQALAGSGICGIAVVSAIYGQPDIQQAAHTLLLKTQEMISK